MVKNKKKIVIFGDSHLTRINRNLKSKFSEDLEGHSTYFKGFIGSNTNQLEYYCVPTLVDEKPNAAIIHIGSNDIPKKKPENVNVNDLAQRIVNIGKKCQSFGVREVGISSILCRNKSDMNEVITNVNKRIEEICKENGFSFICNDNIRKKCLCKDGLHLRNEGISILCSSFLEYFKSILPKFDQNFYLD